ncbi:hypothetical protein [uncultured Limosilactobacillus sp.]|uniref:hypothetical protein n=1 Tax=uncultured Limosilactobacillus sp. TaxID=2837629 RepID=UPI0025E664CD|nr:hypothetical protein [uncultured Limosilactobacillus sp.]
MEVYDYLRHETDDIKAYLRENYDLTVLLRKKGPTDNLTDFLWNKDEITGNGSGSYTLSAYQAERNLFGNWVLLKDAVDELSPGTSILEKCPEWCDVTIRCYLTTSMCIQSSI